MSKLVQRYSRLMHDNRVTAGVQDCTLPDFNKSMCQNFYKKFHYCPE